MWLLKKTHFAEEANQKCMQYLSAVEVKKMPIIYVKTVSESV